LAVDQSYRNGGCHEKESNLGRARSRSRSSEKYNIDEASHRSRSPGGSAAAQVANRVG
jgi:hypothetical protein